MPTGAEGVFPPEGVGGASGGLCPDSSHADDYMSVSHASSKYELSYGVVVDYMINVEGFKV